MDLLRVSQATDIGLVRELNEDSILVGPKDVFVVADGMGGHVAGEIASHIFTATVENRLSSGDAVLDQDGLRYLVVDGNEAIYDCTKENPEKSGMGTTATILHIGERSAFWAHVGDSRLYRLRKGELRQITNDHTYVAELLANGSISADEAADHPNKNMLLRAVGVDPVVKVDTGELALRNGDTFLLCSDGLTNMVTLPAIQTILEAVDCQDKAEALVELAKAGGGFDNISAIVVEYNEE
ncbi:Protein serine/threonine phosphatase PrpC, regulation of stationary phase [Anaerovibrio sp. JC8]|uniref:Stp1/IreP family PP2C-type Ser/Thr phosphatase n=1 Tax=Anaerovibrio sp. JC8 TaxID=1240085 RepID=UPI000A0B80C2|nr:Stp1/IreP family PP2C-type Ser/Thr phosphatase [Anaerovibrio sp. JC8]ORT99630.1 Protein serine/threonine phosphatase PrpC, regulation of stationary phase [Anaerovibrio sp. JC8]